MRSCNLLKAIPLTLLVWSQLWSAQMTMTSDWTVKLKQLQEDYWMELGSIRLIPQSSVTFTQGPSSFLLSILLPLCYMFFSVHWNQRYAAGIAVYSKQALSVAVYGSGRQPFQLYRLTAAAAGGGDGFARVPAACANGALCTPLLLVWPGSQPITNGA